MTESVAVVIVTYNRADLLSRMLDGLAVQTRPVDAIFVVDNASTDHTRDVLVRDDLPLRVTHSEDNLGERAASTSASRRTPPGTTASG